MIPPLGAMFIADSSSVSRDLPSRLVPVLVSDDIRSKRVQGSMLLSVTRFKVMSVKEMKRDIADACRTARLISGAAD